MIYRFRVILDNDVDDDVFRDLEIQETDTLEDLHNIITQSFGFDGTEMASFYISDNQWNQGEEISLFDLSDEAFEHHLKKFETTDFEYLNGYTSSIVQFAKFLQRKNLHLKVICPTLKACIVTSEMLFDDDKKLMELQFGVPVINEYGASELDLISFESP